VARALIAAYWRPQQSDWHPPRNLRRRPIPMQAYSSVLWVDGRPARTGILCLF
jgi:hypothetical protein